MHILPIAFGRFASRHGKITSKVSNGASMGSDLRDMLRLARYYIGPPSLLFYKIRFRNLVAKIQPDLVHAFRIPFEGMLATYTIKEIPLVLSIWGNDITLHAQGSFLMASLTRKVLERADALFADTQRDIGLGVQWGFKKGKPILVVPGSGGIRKINPVNYSNPKSLPEELPEGPVIVNPRGRRPGSLRQDTFFRAIPEVLSKIPHAVFICPSLKGDRESEHLVNTLGIQGNVKLWPRLTQNQLWALFRMSEVFVSPSLHDGTPNSLLEAMECGCFPVVGNIESMREWIRPGVNGALVDATNENSLAEAIVQAINQPTLRLKAAKLNAGLIAERADYKKNMKSVENLYENLIIEK